LNDEILVSAERFVFGQARWIMKDVIVCPDAHTSFPICSVLDEASESSVTDWIEIFHGTEE
jgi:hypothetical protein